MAEFKAVGVGAGYFSRFHYDAWSRIPEVEISAICDLDDLRLSERADEFGIRKRYNDYCEMLEKERPDFVDIITPPPTHLNLVGIAAEMGIIAICQKPLAPTFDEAKAIVETTESGGIRFAVHENWRFQPWYREIKRLLDRGAIGKVHSVYFRSRMGDGWGEDAYLDRQPYFREYPRLLVYENGVHFIDTFRYLFGEITSVYSKMRKLNPVIAGEDRCVIVLEFDGEVEGIWDANRYNESNRENPRYTFGECLVEGLGGGIRLYSDATLTVQKLGERETPHEYQHEDRGFAGDCAYHFQRHFVDRLIDGQPFETNGHSYLATLAVQEAVYESASTGQVVRL